MCPTIVQYEFISKSVRILDTFWFIYSKEFYKSVLFLALHQKNKVKWDLPWEVNKMSEKTRLKRFISKTFIVFI